MKGHIDWSQLITHADKVKAAADQYLASVVADIAERRAVADAAIAPLQDAIDLDDATEAELAMLKRWKKYRLALARLREQDGYSDCIDWPAEPT